MSDASLTAGQIYKFKHRAINELGDSDFSDTIDVGVSDFPAAPDNLTADISSKQSLP